MTLPSGQEVNSMCDSSQANVQDSVSVLGTGADGAELNSSGVEEDGPG